MGRDAARRAVWLGVALAIGAVAFSGAADGRGLRTSRVDRLQTAAAATAGADLSVTKSDSPDPVTVGQQLTYTITVTNNGPDAASPVTLDDTQTSGAAAHSNPVPSQGTCTGSFGFNSSHFTCDL